LKNKRKIRILELWGIVFHGLWETYRLLVWPWNVLDGHQGRHHWT